MTIQLYDLCGASKKLRFSPACWRTRMALEHKGLAYETVPTLFTEIPSILDGGQRTLPVIEDGDQLVRDSYDIAVYLERTYPDNPSLFGGEGGLQLSRFMHWWTGASVDSGIVKLVLADIHSILDQADQGYFRESREKRFGKALEDVQNQSDETLQAFRANLLPLRLALKKHDFLGGDAPIYADYCVFGSFQWARMVSDLTILEGGDPVGQWFERCLDLFEGLGRKAKS
ncbi:MAG: glutathione S-transferase family protein [Cohaesibacter sp.]|jgi:glutathione S-transferase|nr:glutathione S-transferase family protein [Cohaesibacter sp.]